MIEHEVMIKIVPLSVNRAYRGRRFRTPEYEAYERELYYQLPPLPAKMVLAEGITLWIWWGLSNKASDIDNPVKPFQDILQKRYGFNDKMIHELHVFKTHVARGKEYIKFKVGVVG